MTSSGEDEEADGSRRLIDVFIVYLRAVSKSLPSCTGQVVVIFCVLPVSISTAIFLITAFFNFGIAFIAQIVSSLLILVILIPCLAVCLVSAVATAYILQFGHSVYLRLTTPQRSMMIASKLEIEEKLKVL